MRIKTLNATLTSNGQTHDTHEIEPRRPRRPLQTAHTRPYRSDRAMQMTRKPANAFYGDNRIPKFFWPKERDATVVILALRCTYAARQKDPERRFVISVSHGWCVAP